ncbi:MAG: acyl--CoA ligase [Candidatus Kapabacteria bacterium]|nr:acyl--CoA ligase [Candidatus Kapabacteria bacterium]
MDLDPRTNPARSAHGASSDSYTFAFLSWAQVMDHHDRHYGEKPWMIYVDDAGNRHTWSYAVFIDVARRIASIMLEHGVGRGDRVVIAGHNHPDTILQYFACWSIGACAVPLNMTEDDQRLRFIIGDTGARLAFVRSEYRTRVRDCAASDVHLIDVDTDETDPTWYQRIRGTEPIDLSAYAGDMRFDDCLIVYTSGTTGNPKGVVLMQQNLFADGYDIAAWHGIDEHTRMMCVLPIHHVNGTVVTHATPFLAGASVVLHRKFRTDRFFSSIAAEGVHIVSVVPTLLAFLLEASADATDAIASGFRHIICGAGPLTVDLATQFETTYKIPIVHGYGLSETTCYSCFLPVDLSWQEHRSWMSDHGFPSIGIAIPCNEMSIHDAAGNAVAEGERGEIVVRGPNVMREYAGNEKANADAFTFGWFRSGDEGFVKRDAAGRVYYFITGRIKELIIRGGVNIAPLELDEVISAAPGVRAGISVGFENNMYGEEIGALVVKDHPDVTDEDVLAYCRAHLPHHKCPKVVLFSDALPVTSTGKYQRNKVKHLFAAYKDVQFKK